jgi:hypothetical protein
MKKVDERVAFVIRYKLQDLIEYADAQGVNFEVVRQPQQPLATGNHKPVIEVWLKREHTRPQ